MKHIIVFVLLLFISIKAFSVDLEFLTHSAEAYTKLDEKGELRGNLNAGKRAFYVELVRELMTVMNVPKVIHKVPLARGMKAVQDENNYVFFNVIRNAERENTVKWVGPIDDAEGASYFYEMKNAPTGIKTLDDAKKINTIGVLRNSVHESALVAKGFKNLYLSNSYNQTFLMLKGNRVTLIPSNSANIGAKLKEAGISPDEIVQTPVLISDAPGYMAFSKNVADDIVGQWQAALNQVRKSGKYASLYKSYYLETGVK